MTARDGATLALGSIETSAQLAAHCLAVALPRGRKDTMADLHASDAEYEATLLAGAEAYSAREPDRIRAFASHDNLEVRRAVAENTAAPPDVLAQLAAEPALSFDVASNRSAPPQVLARLALSPDAGVRIAVACNPSTPYAVRAALADDTDVLVRAAHPDTPAGELVTLATHALVDVRRCVAGNPATPATALRALGDDPDPHVCARVAGNPAAPPDVLAALARHWVDASADARRVRTRLACNRSTSAATLRDLAETHLAGHAAELPEWDWTLASQIVSHPSTPLETLRRLARCRGGELLDPVIRNPAAPAELLEALISDDTLHLYGFSEEAMARLAGEPSCALRLYAAKFGCVASTETWLRLATAPEREIRRALAVNGETPSAVLATLAADGDPAVFTAALANRNVSLETLTECAEHVEAAVRAAVAENPRLAVHVLAPFAAPLLARLASDPDPRVRLRAAQNEGTPDASLEVLARENSDTIRAAVARNTSAPAATLEHLARDIDLDVRAAVAANVACPPDARALLALDRGPRIPLALEIGNRKRRLQGG